MAVPAGLEAQARASSSLPDGLLVQRLREAAIGERQEITVVVSNVGTEVITVRPGDMIDQTTFTPIIRATLQFAPHENAALPATAARSEEHKSEIQSLMRNSTTVSASQKKKENI